MLVNVRAPRYNQPARVWRLESAWRITRDLPPIVLTMRRVLVLACSERKNADPKPIPAIDRYDGPAFQVLRRYLRTSGDRDLSVWIISAKFGLIAPERRIRPYDRRMTPRRAADLAPAVAEKLAGAIDSRGPSEVFICVGATYRLALQEWQPGQTSVRYSAAGQGRKLRSLKRWLNEHRRCGDT